MDSWLSHLRASLHLALISVMMATTLASTPAAGLVAPVIVVLEHGSDQLSLAARHKRTEVFAPILPVVIRQLPAQLDAYAPALTTTVLLPLIHKAPQAFSSTADAQLAGGTYIFTSFDIPLGVTVTVLSNTVIIVTGGLNITGTLQADCYRLELRGQGEVRILGMVDNRCIVASTNPGDLLISSLGGLTIGTPTAGAPLQTSGNLDVTNDPTLQEWEFDVLPHQRSASRLPPVCSAQADTLEDTVLPGFPIDVAFYGNGADPDGGPVSYRWAFGDGVTSTLQNPNHSFAITGTLDVVLIVTDDDGQVCQATLRLVMDDGEANVPAAPAVWIEPESLVAASGQPVNFTSQALDPQGQPLTVSWAFGNSATSNDAQPIYTYTVPGRYAVTLTLTDTDNVTSVATAAVYIYSASVSQTQALVAAPAYAEGDCIIPGPNVFNPIYNGNVPPAGAGHNGKRAVFRGQGNLYLGGGTSLKAQDGGAGTNRTGAGDIMGGKGGDGGSLHVLVAGSLTVCGGAQFENGNGGAGGSATSNTPASGMAWARGGNGGKAGGILEIKATQALNFVSPFGNPIILDPGNGGAGGVANAIGGDGVPQCPRGKDGASAKANGGNGGAAGKSAFVSGAVAGLGNIQIQGGMGGAGGAGIASGGDGGDATCATTATGGDGRIAEARGGNGGAAKLSGAVAGFGIAGNAFTAGSGGDATALGGLGGDATATPPGGTVATGGKAGKAITRGGAGGAGRINGNGGNSTASGFRGGNAAATGSPGGPCAAGGSATATGGLASDADAIFGKRGGAGAADGMATASAGSGGSGTATGGRGGDCNICPAGKGGDGGPATATGKNGGNAFGNGARTGGNGGAANATGGMGGKGANCCQKFNDKPGGNGGNGGLATSTAGNPGAPAGGLVGANATKGGDGNNGGDGAPPGGGGSKGLGMGVPVDIPDGVDGVAGNICPVPTTWYIYHSTIPDGSIVPGSTLTLTTTATKTVTPTPTPQPTGAVTAYFVSPEEFGAPVQYAKSGAVVFVQSGAISYNLGSLPPSFPVAVVQVELDHLAGPANTVQLIGYVGGAEVARVGTQSTNAGHETLSLPVISTVSTAPKYDSFRLVGTTAFSFDHWWVVIVDP